MARSFMFLILQVQFLARCGRPDCAETNQGADMQIPHDRAILHCMKCHSAHMFSSRGRRQYYMNPIKTDWIPPSAIIRPAQRATNFYQPPGR
jgi:hypothetical protein